MRVIFTAGVPDVAAFISDSDSEAESAGGEGSCLVLEPKILVTPHVTALAGGTPTKL